MDLIKVAFWVLLGAICKCEAKLVHFHQTHPRGQGNELHYDFGYAIQDAASGVVTDRWEERRAGVVKGAYSLLEPGGSVRTVTYQVDGGGGFRAVVKTTRPGVYYLSTQEYLKSNEIHPQPSPELNIPRQLPGYTVPDEDPPINYHAINAEIIGFQKLFGKRVAPRRFQPPSQPKPLERTAMGLYPY